MTTQQTIDIIKASLQMSMQKFCEKELNTSYQSFHYRLKNHRLYPSEVVYIVHRTGRSIEEVFGKSWEDILISSPGQGIDGKVKSILKKMEPEQLDVLKQNLGFSGVKKILPLNKKRPDIEDYFVKTY